MLDPREAENIFETRRQQLFEEAKQQELRKQAHKRITNIKSWFVPHCRL